MECLANGFEWDVEFLFTSFEICLGINNNNNNELVSCETFYIKRWIIPNLELDL